MVDYDGELRLYGEVFRAACGIGPRDHVVDIGFGSGLTTREAARLAVDGSAFGVDVSADAVRRARRLAHEEGLRNVGFECADAQVYGFPERRFDLAISRFGTMFFADPVAAFANIARGLRVGGRLVMMVWQARDRNEWAAALSRVPGAGGGTGAPDAFSLGDPDIAAAILAAAGFVDVGFTEVRRPVYYGPDVPAAVGWVRGFATMTRADPDAVGRLMARHLRDDGVWFDSAAWIVRASRPAGPQRTGS